MLFTIILLGMIFLNIIFSIIGLTKIDSTNPDLAKVHKFLVIGLVLLFISFFLQIATLFIPKISPFYVFAQIATVMFMLLATIMFFTTIMNLRNANNVGTVRNLSIFLTSISLILIGFNIFIIFKNFSHKSAIQTIPQTRISLTAPYTSSTGAMQELQQLRSQFR